MLDKSCKNILVRGVNWIGDAVMTMPALASLKKGLPRSKVSLLVKPWVAPLFENDPHVDEIILYEDEFSGFSGKLKLASHLRKKNFCSSVLLQNAFDAAMLSFLAGIPQRIGYDRDIRGFLLTEKVPFSNDDRKIHHTDYYLNLLQKAGIDTRPSIPYMYLSLEERLRARDLLKDLKRPVIGINPGATYGSTKRWPSERFADVANRIISELGGSIIIFGGPSEIEIATKIYDIVASKTSHFSLLTSHLLMMAGKTSLRELVPLISECDVVLTNDSGPMHISYAVRTPLVAIFGSTDPALTGPLGRGNIVIKKDIHCSPCFKRKCDKQEMLCMNAITSDEVFEAVKKLIPQDRAVFFDRDGTLCKDANYLSKFADLEIFKDVEDVKHLKEKGFKLIGVSNQSGIARGIVKESFTREVNDIFIKKYGFDDFYYCPHHPDERCPCRKPEPEMALRARAEHGIDLKKSYVIGDKELDMLLAKSVGAKGVLVTTGDSIKSEHTEYTAAGIKEAIQWILGTS